MRTYEEKLKMVKHYITNIIDDPHVKAIFDGLSVGAIFTNFFGWLTLSHFALLCSALWTFGRLVEMLVGKPIHRIIGELYEKIKHKG